MRLWLLTLASFLAVLAIPASAWAQTVTLQQAGITRVSSDGSPYTVASTTNMNVFGRVNAKDCYGIDGKGIEYVFPILVAMETMPTAHHIEVWAGGSDCTPLASRQQATAVCWPVSSTTYPPNAIVQYIHVRAQDIASQITAVTHTLTYTPADSKACSSTTALSTITVYFLLLDGTSQPVGTAAAWPMTVKLVGPIAPDPVSADGLPGAVSVHWTAVTDPAAIGYRVYVDDGTGGEGGTTTSSDASGTPVTTCADGGVDDSGDAADGGCTTTIVYGNEGGSTTAACGSGQLVGGQIPVNLTARKTAGKADTDSTVDGLANGSTYSVAVATVDSYDNEGPLSNPVCASPAPVVDFWTRYKGAGGAAGGGVCSLEAPAAPVGGTALTFGMGFAALAWLRRRRGRK